MPESRGRETWGPGKLMAPNHGHPFSPSVGSKWQFKVFPGFRPSSLSYLSNFEEEGSSQGQKCHGNQCAPRLPSWWQPSWKQTYSTEAFAWRTISSRSFH